MTATYIVKDRIEVRKTDNKKMRTIYAIAKKLGISDGSREDELHALVFSTAKKESIALLTDYEADKVIKRLKDLCPKDEVKGKMTEKQKKKAWSLMYTLTELDGGEKKDAALKMRGAVKKILNIDAPQKNPLLWISYEDGTKLIEYLKRYVKSAERKKVKECEKT